jgi:predicted component of type VI protein secretion system
MSWSGEQQRLLAAMGYVAYRRAGAAVQVPASVPVPPAGIATEVREDAIAADDPLWRALQRAAGGRDPRLSGMPPLAQLRADPAAKRALWPQLRALRRN